MLFDVNGTCRWSFNVKVQLLERSWRCRYVSQEAVRNTSVCTTTHDGRVVVSKDWWTSLRVRSSRQYRWFFSVRTQRCEALWWCRECFLWIAATVLLVLLVVTCIRTNIWRPQREQWCSGGKKQLFGKKKNIRKNHGSIEFAIIISSSNTSNTHFNVR